MPKTIATPTNDSIAEHDLQQQTVGEVAAYCRVSARTVKRWIELGLIESKLFGRQRRISRREMLRVAREGVAL